MQPNSTSYHDFPGIVELCKQFYHFWIERIDMALDFCNPAIIVEQETEFEIVKYAKHNNSTFLF